jgi:hypothetical protein
VFTDLEVQLLSWRRWVHPQWLSPDEVTTLNLADTLLRSSYFSHPSDWLCALAKNGILRWSEAHHFLGYMSSENGRLI